jgi:hypothetical protein
MPFLVTAADSGGSRLSRNGIIVTEFLLVCPLLSSAWHDDTTHATANRYRLKTRKC